MLDDLGCTPDAVASSLREAGIRGVPNTVRFLNPVVRYARRCLPDAQSIDLIQGNVLRIVFANGSVSDVAVPEAVLRFLDDFHRGRYPDLELPTGSG